MSSKIKNATKVLLSIGLLFATALPSNASNPQTRKYRIDARAEIIGCFDGRVNRSELEVFGEATIDSKKVRSINRNNWRRRGCGQGVQILKDFIYTPSASNHRPELKIKLFDRDDVNDDDMIGDFTIDISGNRKHTKTRTWGKAGKWEEGSKLTVTVTPLSSQANPRVNRRVPVVQPQPPVKEKDSSSYDWDGWDL